MNKNYYLLATLVYEVINERVINIEINSNKLYYGKRKIDETIMDVNDYLNFLSIDNIYSELLSMEDVNTCEDVINELVGDFSTNFLTVECKIPNKNNFEVQNILKGIQSIEDIDSSISTHIYIALGICIFTIVLLLKYLFNN